MKTQHTHHNSKGFTLVELLVVIAIIAVLAAAGFAGGTAAMNRARKVSTQAAAVSIATAVEQFYAEYSALPDTSTAGSSTDVELNTTTGNGVTLLEVLAGIRDDGQNPRKIRFLTTKEGSGKKGGVIYASDGKSITGMYDSWGQPYYIWLDYDYDERLTFTPQGLSTAVNLNGKRVAVYSLGVDTPGDVKSSTLVKSW
ncbi:MAG: prepilin-type N-terminal cleavage/methylation domain-containing protein [Luteolibacter sp.]